MSACCSAYPNCEHQASNVKPRRMMDPFKTRHGEMRYPRIDVHVRLQLDDAKINIDFDGVASLAAIRAARQP